MAKAVERFLAALAEEQRAKALLRFEDAARFDWHFVPRRRAGLALKEMTAAQQGLAQDLLRTSLSQRGYLKATTVRELENVLLEIEQGSGPTRDPELYSFSIFGEPSPRAPWGFRVEGHHLSLHFTVVSGELIATTPSFFGANPAEVRHGPRQGLRVLAAEEDLARALVTSLDEEQRARAVFDTTAPPEILTFNAPKVDPLEPVGIATSHLDEAQLALLQRLLKEYASALPARLAAARMSKLRRAGLEKVQFGWAGGLLRGEPHYYRVQGPTFLIEFDNTQNNANHIHSVWRDFDGDFGRDLLREHYRDAPHTPQAEEAPAPSEEETIAARQGR